MNRSISDNVPRPPLSRQVPNASPGLADDRSMYLKKQFAFLTDKAGRKGVGRKDLVRALGPKGMNVGVSTLHLLYCLYDPILRHSCLELGGLVCTGAWQGKGWFAILFYVVMVSVVYREHACVRGCQASLPSVLDSRPLALCVLSV